jgi:hypothetical protein
MPGARGKWRPWRVRATGDEGGVCYFNSVWDWCSWHGISAPAELCCRIYLGPLPLAPQACRSAGDDTVFLNALSPAKRNRDALRTPQLSSPASIARKRDVREGDPGGRTHSALAIIRATIAAYRNISTTKNVVIRALSKSSLADSSGARTPVTVFGLLPLHLRIPRPRLHPPGQ